MSAPAAALGQLPQELAACLPLVVGVTGHRDLDGSDQARIKAALRQVLNDLRIRFPNTNVMLVSALAPGADQLAAEVGLNEGAYLAAVLPMPADIYVQTFDRNGNTPDVAALARDQFADLRKQAIIEFQIPLADGVTRELLTDSDL